MMQLLPVAFTASIARFPAGLFVYWVTSNTVTLVQNYLIYRLGGPIRGTSVPSTAENTLSETGDYDTLPKQPADNTKSTLIPSNQRGRKTGRSRKKRKKRK